MVAPVTVRLSKSSVGEEEKNALARVIANGYLGMGDEVCQFEEEIAAYIGGGRQVICVSTGTAALHLAVAALDIGPGEEVLAPTITYVASYQAISATGAKPVSCDVRSNDIFFDVEDAKKRLTERTRAIMPVQYASNSAGMDAVYKFAQDHKLRVIEDAAHSFGCEWKGKKVGAEGDVVCFSFDGIKNITCGEGGAIVTSDETVAQRARDGRLLGVEKDTENRYAGKRSWTFDVRRQGFRYHMSNLNAAIGREQLKKLPVFASRRQQIAAGYRDGLRGVNSVTLLDMRWEGLVPHIFVVRVTDGRRDALREYLRGQGIETGFHYQPNHSLSLYANNETLPVAERVADELLTLPMHADMTDEQQQLVIAGIRQFMAER